MNDLGWRHLAFRINDATLGRGEPKETSVADEILLLAGTRPEAIKVAPVAIALADHPVLRPVLVNGGQHSKAVVRQAWGAFGLVPDVEIAVERRSGSQAELAAAILPALDQVMVERQPAVVLVQGDTTTTLAGALAAFWRGIPVAHLEAGLRSGTLATPFPEEGNRQMVARIASLHLAPTLAAAEALSRESVPHEEITITGNTVIDAVRHIVMADRPSYSQALADVERELDATSRRLVLVTAHRRESWGAPLHEVLSAVRDMVHQHPDITVLLPAHPNPAVRAQVIAALANQPRVHVTDPLDYPDLIRALHQAALVLTDSGGLQEEAPSFGVPVLVLRPTTERMEAVHAGYARLVGTDRDLILKEADRLLSARTRLPPDSNPFGDGHAAKHVVAALEHLLDRLSG